MLIRKLARDETAPDRSSTSPTSATSMLATFASLLGEPGLLCEVRARQSGLNQQELKNDQDRSHRRGCLSQH